MFIYVLLLYKVVYKFIFFIFIYILLNNKMIYIQPQFVKFKDINVYTRDNCELHEDTGIIPDEVKNQYFLYYALSYEEEAHGVPAIYVNLDSVNRLDDFVGAIQSNISLLLEGTPYFKINKDYWINEGVENFILSSNKVLPNQTNRELIINTKNLWSDHNKSVEEPTVTNYNIEEQSNSSEETQFITTDKIQSLLQNDNIIVLPSYWLNQQVNDLCFDIVPVEELYNILQHKNEILSYEFSEDELNNFYSTFCNLILNGTEYQDRTLLIDQIYDNVLNYYSNFQIDTASVKIALMLNSLYSVKDKSTTSCGCTNSIIGAGNNDALCATSCADYYKSSMQEYLKTMLGDVNFYKNWMFIQTDITKEVNDVLVNKLITLIQELIKLDYNLDFNKKTSSMSCDCPVVDNSASECNYKILNNYLLLLNWVKNNEIDENTNKIKIYGEQFGALLPNLQF